MTNLGVSGSTAQGRAAEANRRDYLGLLWVIAAGVMGFTLLCSVSAVALGDPSLSTPVSIASVSIVDLAFSDVNKGGALTAEASSRILTAIPTMFPTSTLLANSTSVAFGESATVVIPITSFQATSTKRPRPVFIQPNTAAPKPTRTPRPRPTKTQIPPSNTPLPPPTSTPVPPTSTNPPPPTNTPLPPPPPTATDAPPPTATDPPYP